MHLLTDRRTPWLVSGMALLLLAVQALLPAGDLRHALIFLALWIFPALLWARWISAAGDPLAALCGGAGLALFVPVLLVLLATYLPGPLPPNVLAAVALLALILPLPTVVAGRGSAGVKSGEASWNGAHAALPVAVLLLAAWLRLENVTYKEFQGDEGVIMVRAAQAISGDELALLRHQKGPVEILLPLLPWGLGGAIDESWARAPFVWAGWLVVPAIATLGKRWLGLKRAWIAALLFTIGGFAIAFSRIVQYQSLVMLWGALALLFADRYRQEVRLTDLLLAAAFMAGGLLAHYDAILVAPAIVWLVLGRWRQSPRLWQAHLAVAGLLGAALLALFYAPYLANPTIGNTGSYLLQDRLGGTLLGWSGPEVWQMATFYNSTYTVLFLLLLAALGLAAAVRRQHAPAILYFLTPLLFYTIVVADPRTHIYTVFPGLALIAMAGASFVDNSLRHRLVRLAGRFIFMALVAVSLLYVYRLLVDVTPERQRTWHENRPPYFPTTWSEPPRFGLFGFPHQAGWRVAPSHVLALPYSSNEEPEITDWYMAQAPRTHCPDFATFLVAANAQDALPYDAALVAQRPLQTVITVNGVPSLHIYGEADGLPQQVEAVGRRLWRTPAEIAPPMHTGENRVGADFANGVRLLGYSVDTQAVEPGETVTVVLYWQAQAPIERNYQVFVHLYDGEMWAQHDGAPGCAIQPTSGWELGQIVRDAHLLSLPPDTPAGALPVLVGMYDLITGERSVVNGADHIHLTDLDVARR